MKNRENNYDLLRIIAAFSVITSHVSSVWTFACSKYITAYGLAKFNSLYMFQPIFSTFYNSIIRFCVPCFLMLSGAFVLDNDKNLDYKKFYSKTFEKLVIPAIIFTIIYYLYRIPLCFLGLNGGFKVLIHDLIYLYPWTHMWYLYVLIVIYLLVPIVLRFKNSISDKTFYKVSFVFLILACLCLHTSSASFNWDIGRSFLNLGYFMVGYSIRKLTKVKNNKKGLLMITCGLLVELILYYLEYQQIKLGVSDSLYNFVQPSAPIVVIASLLIFYGFSLLKINKSFGNLPTLTFYIYLIHSGLWYFLQNVLDTIIDKNIFLKLNAAIFIPLAAFVVFVLSYFLSKLYLFLWGKIDKDKRVTNRLLKLFHLNLN